MYDIIAVFKLHEGVCASFLETRRSITPSKERILWHMSIPKDTVGTLFRLFLMTTEECELRGVRYEMPERLIEMGVLDVFEYGHAHAREHPGTEPIPYFRGVEKMRPFIIGILDPLAHEIPLFLRSMESVTKEPISIEVKSEFLSLVTSIFENAYEAGFAFGRSDPSYDFNKDSLVQSQKDQRPRQLHLVLQEIMEKDDDV